MLYLVAESEMFQVRSTQNLEKGIALSAKRHRRLTRTLIVIAVLVTVPVLLLDVIPRSRHILRDVRCTGRQQVQVGNGGTRAWDLAVSHGIPVQNAWFAVEEAKPLNPGLNLGQLQLGQTIYLPASCR